MTGSLTEKQKQKAQEWIKEKWVNKSGCEICGNTNWVLAEDLITPMIFSEGGGITIGGGLAYPHAMFICDNCGNTKLINAMISRILEKEKKEEKNAG